MRTVYRDIETLSAQGADICGEAGMEFVLKQNYALPPLMLNAKKWGTGVWCALDGAAGGYRAG